MDYFNLTPGGVPFAALLYWDRRHLHNLLLHRWVSSILSLPFLFSNPPIYHHTINNDQDWFKIMISKSDKKEIIKNFWRWSTSFDGFAVQGSSNLWRWFVFLYLIGICFTLLYTFWSWYSFDCAVYTLVLALVLVWRTVLYTSWCWYCY